MKTVLTVIALLALPTAFGGNSLKNVLDDCNSRIANGQGTYEKIEVTCTQTRDRWARIDGQVDQKVSKPQNLTLAIDLGVVSKKVGNASQSSGTKVLSDIVDLTVEWSCPKYQREKLSYTTSRSFASCDALKSEIATLGMSNLKENDLYVAFCRHYTDADLLEQLAALVKTGVPAVQGSLASSFKAVLTCDTVTFCAGEEAPRVTSCSQ